MPTIPDVTLLPSPGLRPGAGRPTAARIRAEFPALAGRTAFFDNAGGSQVPRGVAERVREHLLGSYVQLGAEYGLSRRAKEVVTRAHDLVKVVMNASGSDDGDAGEVVLGASSSALCEMLAACYGEVLGPGSEVVVCDGGHESNVGPWMRLARRGVVVKAWPVDPRAMSFPIETLEGLLTERTRLVAFQHVSNILGGVLDVRRITAAAHRVGARVVVDGVAYAPHRAIDVAGWGVDWYFYSIYKVFGPHMAALFGTHEAFAELTGPNHFFVGRDALPSKFELGGVSHEGCAGVLGLWDYLCLLAGRGVAPEGTPFDRAVVDEAFDVMTELELPLQERLLSYLHDKPGVRVIGPSGVGGVGGSDRSRVCTVSFAHATKRSREIARAANAEEIGIRYGHFYSYRLCEALGLDPHDGVVRVSPLHYNTIEEVDRLIGVLERVL